MGGGGGGGGGGVRLAGGKWEESNLSRGLANSVCVEGERGIYGVVTSDGGGGGGDL